MLVEASGGGCSLFQKPSQNQRPDTSPILTGFETRYPRAPAFFPPASNLQGGRGGREHRYLYVLAHEYSNPLEYAASNEKR